MGVRGDMEPRSSLHRTCNGESPVVYNARIYNAPLLPFEKQLIETIGATEEEYRFLVTEAIKRGRVRPAGYEHVPDIRATGAEGAMAQFLISLAVGVTLSVITYLLTPKPKEPKGQKRERFGDINNAGRFNPTHGFDSQAELANYGDPIPIIFGKAEFNGEKYLNGGMLVTPKVVWSRMLSWGTQQAVKLGFIVGEQGREAAVSGILPPALSGIFIGNNPLDSIYSSSFAFYWRRKSGATSGNSRVLKQHFRYGDSAIRSIHPTADEILRCPTKDGDGDTGFSGAYSPSNNTEFGCFSAIPNGSPYRVNWTHVSMPDPGSGKEGGEHSNELAWQRIKIAGWYTDDRDDGDDNKGPGWRSPHHGTHDHEYYTQGTGRNYSRRMGLRFYHKWNGSGHDAAVIANSNEVVKIIDNVGVKDVVEFYIQPGVQKLDKYIYEEDSGVRVDDINSEIDAPRQAADDALQVGEVFQIGMTVWRVKRRDLPIWKPTEDNLQKIWLECIDNNNGVDNKIGLVCDALLYPNHQETTSGSTTASDGVTVSPGRFGRGWINDTNDPGISKIPGPNFYPLLRRSKAVFKNTRECETTEIGIRSKVNQQLSGLCNFQSLLSPPKLHELENDNVAVQSGTISTLTKRASLFSIKVRDTDTSYNDELEGWKDLGMLFAIIGSSSVDQYNQIRMRHSERKRYEYQIVPVPGAGIREKADDTLIWHVKDSLPGKTEQVNVNGVIFTVQFDGEATTKEKIKLNEEFVGDFASVVTTTTATTLGAPTEIVFKDYIVGKNDWDNLAQITQTTWSGINWAGTGVGADEGGKVDGNGRHSAFLWELFGSATNGSNSSKNEVEGVFDFTTTKQTRNKPVRLKIRAKRVVLPSGHWMASGGSAGESETHTWNLISVGERAEANTDVSPVNTSTDRNIEWTGPHRRADGTEYSGDMFRIQKSCANSNPWAQNASEGPLAYAGIQVNVTGHAYINDVVRGKSRGMTDEIFGGDASLHEEKIVQIKLCENGDMDSENSSNTGWKTNITSDDARTLTVKFKGKMVDIRPHWSGRYRGWDLKKITIVSSTGDWDENNEIDFYKETINNASNPFWRTIQGKLGYKLRISKVADDSTQTGTTVDTTDARVFEAESQYSDISYYGNLVQKSNETSPEHQLVYVNEITSNDVLPTYEKTTTSALVLKAGRNFTTLDQVRVWLKEGIHVENLHPDDSSSIGPSNLFTDLIYYLLIDRVGGAGQALGSAADSESLVDKTQLATTSKFLRTNKLFFNGALADPVNLRSYIAEMAPNFLCDFILADGKFSCRPTVPVDDSGEISDGAVEIKQLFTSGNILEDSFRLEYVQAEERRKFKAVVRYRKEAQNKLPYEETVTVRHAGGDGTEPIETFDLTGFCTTKEHAQLVGKYYLSLRERVKHTCTFKTTPYGLDLAPGDCIRVTTESSPYNAANNGSISASGVITSVKSLPDGSYSVLYYALNTDTSEIESATMQVSNGNATESKFFNSIFSVVSTTDSQNVYRVEQLTLDQENTVEIVASEYPCDSNLVSLMAKDLRSSNAFIDDTGAYIPYHLE